MDREILTVVEGTWGQFVTAGFQSGHEHRRSDCPDFQAWLIQEGEWQLDRPTGATARIGQDSYLRFAPFEKCHRIVRGSSLGSGLRIFRSPQTEKLISNGLALRKMTMLSSFGKLDPLTLDCLIQDLPVARKTRPPKWLVKVSDFLHDEPQAQWSIQQYADLAGISPSRLIHEFRAHYGERLFEARNRLRIERFYRTGESAFALGFYDQAHFHRETRKRMQ